jgi:hypothetical protein
MSRASKWLLPWVPLSVGRSRSLSTGFIVMPSQRYGYSFVRSIVSAWIEPGSARWQKFCLHECSSPELFREFVMTIYPLSHDDRQGLLIVNALKLVRKHDRMSVEPFEATYRHDNGLISQCASCRSVKRCENVLVHGRAYVVT